MDKLSTDELRVIANYLPMTDKVNFFTCLWRFRLIKADTMITAFELLDRNAHLFFITQDPQRSGRVADYRSSMLNILF
jgi:hypothetical protein